MLNIQLNKIKNVKSRFLPGKKAILAIAAVLFSLGVFAQADSTNRMNQDMNNTKTIRDMNSNQMDNQSMDKSKKDCVMMKDGKMMVMKDGKTMAMDKDMTMSNGTQVMTDGTVMKADGSKMMMKNGD